MPAAWLWSGPRPAGSRRHFVALVALTAIVLVALLLRARLLTDIPRYTDEINEIIPAFDIARGRSLPLTSGPKHIGALFDYVLAGAMLVFGRSPDLPRLVVLVAGLATVVLAYGYARSLGGRSAGLLAAGLLALSAPHVLLSSRVAWSASLTPLLCLGAAWALDLAVSRRQGIYLLPAGLLAGLALQAHPSVAALLPGLGAFAVLRGRPLLRSPYPYAAGLSFLVGCANVLSYNWQSGSGALRSIGQQYPGQTVGPAAFLQNLAAPVRGLALTLSSALDPVEEHSLTEPFVLLVIGVSLGALIAVARRESALPLLAVLGAMLSLPLLHGSFDPLLKARYIMPLVPLVFVAIGVCGARYLAMPIRSRSGALRAAAVLGAWLAILGGTLLSLVRFESAALAADCTNAPQRAFVAVIEQHRAPGEWVLLDEGLLPSGERMGYLTLLELSGRKIGEATLGRGGIRRELAERPSFLTAVSDGKAAGLFERQGVALLPHAEEPVLLARRAERPSGNRGAGGIGLYRVTAQGATLLAHDPEPGCGNLRLN